MTRNPRLVSVVVPSYNAGAHLQEQLAALMEQDYVGPMEVIVADNGSRDGSIQSASSWAHSHAQVRIIDASGRRAPGAARNSGTQVARGDFFAFCDADDLATQSWLRLLVQTASEADIVGGLEDHDRLNDGLVRACLSEFDPARPHLGFLPATPGGNLGVWANVFAALRGFDERRSSGEDIEFVWRAQLRGYVFRPSSAVVHRRLPTDLRDIARRYFRYGMGDALLYRQFAAAGMPRRRAGETWGLWYQLVTGLPAERGPERRYRWVLAVALSCGRLVGSMRYRVVFT